MSDSLTLLTLENPVVQLLMAAMLGSFLGLRREIIQQKKGHGEKLSFMGVRTMTLLSLLGALSTNFNLDYLPVVFFVLVCVLISISYIHGSFFMKKIGLTTELSAMATFWIGVLVGTENEYLAIVLTLILAAINAFKSKMHHFAKTLTLSEWFGAFQLFVFSGAVLPFLPKEAIDAWGIFVPFKVWLLVLLISGLGFMGYFAIKYFGTRGGIPLTAFFGAIVSSTALTTAFATQSKKAKSVEVFAFGILLASATMHVKMTGELFFLAPKGFLSMFILFPIVMAIVGYLVALYFYKTTFKVVPNLNLETDLKQPFELIPAIKFGLIFVIVLFTAEFGKRYFGESGVYMTAFFTGLVDADAMVLSSLESVRLGTSDSHIAENAIAIAIFTNTLVKILYVFLLGSKELTKKISIGILLSVMAGGLTLFGISFL